jgi:hypothetical protein
MVDITELKPGVKVTDSVWHGIVVFNNSINEYLQDYPRAEWAYQGPGFMVLYDEVGLVFYETVNEEISIIQ